MKVIGFALAGSILALTITGCLRHEEKRLVNPAPPAGTARSEVAEAHWIFQGSELTQAVQAASASPLVRRALVEAPQPNLRFRSESAIAAVGLGTDGLRYRVTILPYADPADPNRATFLTLLSRDSLEMCQRSELLASPTRVSPDSGYAPITIFGRTLYLREDAAYVPANDGSARLSPERFNKQKFMACLFAGLQMVGRISDSICSGVPDYPRCMAISNTVGTVVVAIGCGIFAFFG
ncbi:MAG: hypothetical protein HY568_04995 [Candidatus Latescibacteria bacterium]|nr:hypothetical protein [Candidatus Latescibacterota bacterium]